MTSMPDHRSNGARPIPSSIRAPYARARRRWSGVRYEHMFDSIQPGAATILHADLDAFYASVEQLLDPSLAGRPIAVGGGVVLAASYEAKAYGVHAGMAGWRARQLCPGLTFAGGHFKEYQRLGGRGVTRAGRLL